MDEFKKREDYREACKKLDGLYSLNKFQDELRYLMLFKKQETKQKDLCLIVRVYNGKMIWMQKLDRKYMDEMIQKTDIKGNYSSFCELIRYAITQDSFDLVQYSTQLDIALYFVLQKNVQLKGQIPLDEGLPITNDEDTRLIQFQFVCDLADSLQQEKVKITKEIDTPQQQQKKKKQPQHIVDIDQVPEKKIPSPPKKSLFAIGTEILESEEIIEKKGAFGRPVLLKGLVRNSDLMNPLKKKRKMNGVQL